MPFNQRLKIFEAIKGSSIHQSLATPSSQAAMARCQVLMRRIMAMVMVMVMMDMVMVRRMMAMVVVMMVLCSLEGWCCWCCKKS